MSTLLEPSTWPLHSAQALIYAGILVLCQRESAWGAGAGAMVATLWNSANLFATGFIPLGVKAVGASLRTHHLQHPAYLLVLLGAAGHFLMLAGCLALLARSRPRRWGQFAGGGVLLLVALFAIFPLRHHSVPLPLDVAPAHDVSARR